MDLSFEGGLESRNGGRRTPPVSGSRGSGALGERRPGGVRGSEPGLSHTSSFGSRRTAVASWWSSTLPPPIVPRWKRDSPPWWTRSTAAPEHAASLASAARRPTSPDVGSTTSSSGCPSGRELREQSCSIRRRRSYWGAARSRSRDHEKLYQAVIDPLRARGSLRAPPAAHVAAAGEHNDGVPRASVRRPRTTSRWRSTVTSEPTALGALVHAMPMVERLVLRCRRSIRPRAARRSSECRRGYDSRTASSRQLAELVAASAGVGFTERHDLGGELPVEEQVAQQIRLSHPLALRDSAAARAGQPFALRANAGPRTKSPHRRPMSWDARMHHRLRGSGGRAFLRGTPSCRLIADTKPEPYSRVPAARNSLMLRQRSTSPSRRSSNSAFSVLPRRNAGPRRPPRALLQDGIGATSRRRSAG